MGRRDPRYFFFDGVGDGDSSGSRWTRAGGLNASASGASRSRTRVSVPDDTVIDVATPCSAKQYVPSSNPAGWSGDGVLSFRATVKHSPTGRPFAGEGDEGAGPVVGVPDGGGDDGVSVGPAVGEPDPVGLTGVAVGGASTRVTW